MFAEYFLSGVRQLLPYVVPCCLPRVVLSLRVLHRDPVLWYSANNGVLGLGNDDFSSSAIGNFLC